MRRVLFGLIGAAGVPALRGGAEQPASPGDITGGTIAVLPLAAAWFRRAPARPVTPALHGEALQAIHAQQATSPDTASKGILRELADAAACFSRPRVRSEISTRSGLPARHATSSGAGRRSLLVALVLTSACFAQTTRERITLAQAEQVAVKGNPRIGVAESSAFASAQVKAQIRSSFYPTLSGNITGAGAPADTRIAAGGLNNPAIFSRFASGFTASQMITDFGRTSALAQSAELRANSRFEVQKATQADVLLAVNRAYYAGLRAQGVLTIAERTVAARQAIVDYVRALADSKMKSELDVRFAEVNLAEAKLLLETAASDRSTADAELSYALGYGEAHSFELVDEPTVELPSTNPARLVEQALSRRPEVAGQRFELEAAQKIVEAERKLKFPTISAAASLGAIPAYAERLGNNHYAAAGLNVSIPWLNGGLYNARRAEAEYNAQANRRRLDEVGQRIARDVSVAVLAAQSAAQRMALTAQLLRQATLALDLAQARYELGLSSIVELSQAQLARTNAEIQSIGSKYDYQIQRALVAYHIGDLR